MAEQTSDNPGELEEMLAWAVWPDGPRDRTGHIKSIKSISFTMAIEDSDLITKILDYTLKMPKYTQMLADEVYKGLEEPTLDDVESDVEIIGPETAPPNMGDWVWYGRVAGKTFPLANAYKGINPCVSIDTKILNIHSGHVTQALEEAGFEIRDTIPRDRQLYELGYHPEKLGNITYIINFARTRAFHGKSFEQVTSETTLRKLDVKIPEKKEPPTFTPSKPEEKVAYEKTPPKYGRAKFLRKASIAAVGVLGATAIIGVFKNQIGDLLGLPSQRNDLGDFYKAEGSAAAYVKNGELSIVVAGSDISDVINKNSVISGLRNSSDRSIVSILDIANDDSVVYSGEPKQYEAAFDPSQYAAVDTLAFPFDDKDKWETREDKNIAVTGRIVELNGKYHLQFSDNYVVIGDADDVNKLKLSFAKDNNMDVTLYGTIGQTVPWSNRRNSHRLFTLNPAGVMYNKK